LAVDASLYPSRSFFFALASLASSMPAAGAPFRLHAPGPLGFVTAVFGGGLACCLARDAVLVVASETRLLATAGRPWWLAVVAWETAAEGCPTLEPLPAYRHSAS
jgi:hypothetical protein